MNIKQLIARWNETAQKCSKLLSYEMEETQFLSLLNRKERY